MNCAACGAGNSDRARFCQQCGTALQRTCPRCSAEVGPAAKFCPACGLAQDGAGARAPPPAGPAPDRFAQYIPKVLQAKLEAVRAGHAMVGERRNVTILFCDVKGSTAAAERLDPEDWAEIMNGAFELLIAPVYRYEGTLARLMGDAVLAFFGAPIAHEDDPQRSILAGLAMVQEIGVYRQQVKQRWKIDFDVRVGINTGLVVVGEVGSDMRLEYTAMGDAVNVAARMEQAAQPGTVLVSGETGKLVAPLFDLEEMGAIEVKGKERPVPAWRVLRPRTRPGRLRGIEGLDSPMIGRDHPMAELRSLAGALVRGSGHLVSIQGEAGLGKSRLLAELKAALRDDATTAELAWLEGRALSYQAATPYASIADLLSGHLGLAPGADYAALGAALVDRAGAEAARVAPYLASLLGIPVTGDDEKLVKYLDPPALRRRVSDAVVDHVTRLARARPVLMVFEDLHWADASSLEILDQLMPLAESERLLLCALFRPRPQEPSWRFHETASRDWQHRYHAIVLQPLEDGDARLLVSNLLHVEGLPASVREMILARAEGNPFFVEEVIRSLLDRGAIVRHGESFVASGEIASIALPGSLSALLTARLDHLDEPVRRVLQTASVIGREFELDTIASLIEPLELVRRAITDLQQRGLIRERVGAPSKTYAFKHVLVQEAAYESMLLRTRRELHRSVADVMVRLGSQASGEIARHFLEAREEALALPHLVDAGERAARAYAAVEALGRFDRAIEILEGGVVDLELARRAYLGRGQILAMQGNVPAAIASYEAMKQFGARQGDSPLQVAALNQQGKVKGIFLGDLAGGLSLLDTARGMAQEADCTGGLAEGCMIRCALYTAQGDFDSARRFLQEAVSLGAAQQDEDAVLYGRTHIANTLIWMTDYDRAYQEVREAMQLAEQRGNRLYLAELKTFGEPACLLRQGDVEGALAAAREGVRIAGEIGHSMALCNGALFLGRMAHQRGWFEEAIAENERALAAGRASGFPFLESLALCTLGTSYLSVGERLQEKALRLHAQALEMMQGPIGNYLAAQNWCEVGYCTIEIGKIPEAREHFERGLRDRSAAMYIVRAELLVGAAIVALLQGRLDDARVSLAEARSFVEERAMKHVLPMLDLASGRLAAAEGQGEAALDLLGRAGAQAEAMGFLPVVQRVAAESARILDGLGRAGEADGKRRREAEVASVLVARFRDPELRAIYLERRG